MSPLRPTGGNAWRFPAAAACLIAAAAHVPVTPGHLAESVLIGASFLALEVAAVVVAALLLLRPGRAPGLLAALLGAAAIAAYAASRTVGLPTATDEIGNWTEPLGLVAVAAESGMVAFGLLSARRRVPRRRVRPALLGSTAFLAGGLTMTVLAAGAEPLDATGHAAGMTSSGYWSRVAGAAVPKGGTTRHYYVSADQVVWNYAPTGRNEITGKPFDETAATFTEAGPGRIGPRYLKCLYRAYTDATFARLQQRPAADRYLGLLGPVIRAEVGDTIRVVFRNACPFPTSMHPHGVFYTKDSEGAPYADGTGGKDRSDDAVARGSTHTYVWKVPQRAGPGPEDGSSVMWMYHSHTDEVADTYAGLMGPIIITGAGLARADGSPKDVDREIVTDFFIDNEAASPLLPANMKRFLHGRVPHDLLESDDFAESNLKHSINGYLYGTGPMITVRRGERVRWYVMDMGTEVDLHTPHWHGNDVTVGGMRMDVVSLLPASMIVADMVPDDPGTWLFHCHVHDHITAGMMTRYRVTG